MVGKVRDVRQWQESWVSGSFNSGYKQHRADKQKFWIVGDGFEEEIHSPIRVRENHDVACVWIGKNGLSGSLAVIYNKVTGEHVWHLIPGEIVKNLFNLFMIFMVSSIIMVPFSMYQSGSVSGFLFGMLLSVVFFGISIYWIVKRSAEKNFWDKLTDQALIFARE